VRLWWVLVNGGQWAANEPILRLARSSGCLASLPLIITAADVQQATADKTVFLNRPEAICQYSLYAHQLGQNTQLTRTANWRDELGWWVVRVHSDQETEEQTVPAEYAEQFDAADPPCRHFRDVIIQELTWSSRCASLQFWHPPSGQSFHIYELIDQQPPLWGCRTIVDYTSDHSRFGNLPRRLVILCGDEEGDDFAAFIRMFKHPDGLTSIELLTTEVPQRGVSGPGALSQTLALGLLNWVCWHHTSSIGEWVRAGVIDRNEGM